MQIQEETRISMLTKIMKWISISLLVLAGGIGGLCGGYPGRPDEARG
jgi:hypothetical protein